ncbi:SDR family oxidoreductase [Nocardiopsis suaedae]|uniref:NAD(P)H-binding protein n=1 Tax=Nocardiopsis suaedae TaxID=3018444 RepID=A0ABT4TX11_9ACTN|nr:NAD(P)H-binding protein [Nocardiopsis suaedae]MDA2808775.1 NAD(P)H-binding protein [Nocardiopsis suaedae]
MTTHESLTVLVTGATGTVGRALVRRLLADGHRVRALTRDPARAVLPEGCAVVGGDLTDPSTLGAAFRGVDAAHLITFGGDDFAPLDTGPQIADLCARNGARRVTVLGGDVEPGPVEGAVEAAGLSWTRLAPVEFMANKREWAPSVAAESTVRAAFADVPSALVHEADIADVAAAVLASDGHGGREYPLTGPEALTVRDQVRIVADVLDRDVRLVEQSREEAVEEWRAAGFSAEDIAFFLAMRTDPPEFGYSVRPTVQEVTGRPARTFAQWVGEHALAFTS